MTRKFVMSVLLLASTLVSLATSNPGPGKDYVPNSWHKEIAFSQYKAEFDASTAQPSEELLALASKESVVSTSDQKGITVQGSTNTYDVMGIVSRSVAQHPEWIRYLEGAAMNIYYKGDDPSTGLSRRLHFDKVPPVLGIDLLKQIAPTVRTAVCLAIVEKNNRGKAVIEIDLATSKISLSTTPPAANTNKTN